MRDRHWKQLMRVTGMNVAIDARFMLEDLLSLGLHKYIEEASAIVDRANKELQIDASLEKVRPIFESCYHKRRWW